MFTISYFDYWCCNGKSFKILNFLLKINIWMKGIIPVFFFWNIPPKISFLNTPLMTHNLWQFHCHCSRRCLLCRLLWCNWLQHTIVTTLHRPFRPVAFYPSVFFLFASFMEKSNSVSLVNDFLNKSLTCLL